MLCKLEPESRRKLNADFGFLFLLTREEKEEKRKIKKDVS
jgi:hypothetical protein